MADFRKWFLAFAVLALIAGTASAQGLTCTANAGVPPLLRAEGLTEQVGDVVLNCTGGTPTPAGLPIPPVNVQVFLSTPITSRLTATGAINWSAALLLVDEPRPASNGGGAFPTFSVCSSPNGAVSGCAMTGIGPVQNPTPAGIYAGPYSTGGERAAFNVFQGQQVSQNSIAFLGVPFDAPGTIGGTRVLRITNIRTAPGAPSSSLIPQPVVEYISITGSTSVPVNNPQQIVGYTQYGLDQGQAFSSNTVGLSTCTGQNRVSGGSITGNAQLYVTAAEGFASAFKVRNTAQVPASPAFVDTLTTANAPQDIPGLAYQTETGFYMSTDAGSTANGIQNAGLATQGTRLAFALGNAPTGATLYAPTTVPLFQKGNFGRTTGYAVLVSTDASIVTSGSSITQVASSVSATNAQLSAAYGNTVSPNAFTNAAVGPNGGIGTAGLGAANSNVGLIPVGAGGVLIYEVVQTDTSLFEQLSVPVFVGFATSSTLDTSITANGTVSFSPISTETPATAAASSSLPIPRFVRSGPNGNTFRFNPCFCNILFPYVTTLVGYDTGIAISNTSLDPFGTTGSTGTITLNFYGTGAAPSTGATGMTYTTGPVPPGGMLGWAVGGGNGVILSPGAQTGTSAPVAQQIPAMTNFSGYIIAQSRFQYCHGIAYLTCAGCGATNPGASESYLGLIMDVPGAYRTGNTGENLGQ